MTHLHFTPPIDRPLHQEELEKLTELIPYCGEGIVDWHIQNELPVQIVCTLEERADPEQVEGLLASAFQHAKNAHKAEGRILFDQGTELRSTPEETDQALPGEVHELSEGLWVFGPAFGKVVQALDRTFLAIADQYQAEELLVPSLTPGSQLHQAGYPRNFPHHVAAVHVLPHNLNRLQEFSSGGSSSENEFEFSGNFLLPAACLNCYPYFTDIPIPEPYTFTVRAQCSRYEAGRMVAPTRLWNFRMREIVHLGTEASASGFRQQVLEQLVKLLKALGLPIRVAAASDPFFIDYGNAIANYQKAQELKYEILAQLPGQSKPLAIGSLNLHQTYFGKSFQIEDPSGQPVSSACVAFGLERWAYWLVSHLGTDLSTWPKSVKKTLGLA